MDERMDGWTVEWMCGSNGQWSLNSLCFATTKQQKKNNKKKWKQNETKNNVFDRGMMTYDYILHNNNNINNNNDKTKVMKIIMLSKFICWLLLFAAKTHSLFTVSLSSWLAGWRDGWMWCLVGWIILLERLKLQALNVNVKK